MALRKKGVVTDEERYKMQVAQELELFRLERKYKLMERDRLTLATGGGSKLAKHTKVLKILTKEHQEILKDLNVAASSTNKKKYDSVMKNLRSLLKEHEEFTEAIKNEKKQLFELDFHTKNLEKDIIEKKKNLVTELNEQQAVLLAQKNLEALENKLETATRRFCTIIYENETLREQINHYLQERAQFNILWKRLIDNLTKGKKFMLDVIEQATIAYDQRDECCLKLQALKNRAHSDYVLHSQEMLRLQRNIDADRELEEFLSTKGQRRLLLDLEQMRAIKQRETREELEQQLVSYQQMLAEIAEFTGETDVAKIADKFMKTETENFGRFVYINDLNRQMEILSGELGKLHKEIDQQTALRQKRAEGQSEKIQMLEETLAKIDKNVVVAQKQYETVDQRLNSMMSSVEQIFNMCKCDSAPLLQLLGNNTSINHFNACMYLQLLEEQVNILMMSAYYKQKTGDKKKAKDNIIQDETLRPIVEQPVDMVNATPCPLCIEQDQVIDLVETVQFALTRPEIEERLEELVHGPEAREVDHNVSVCHLPKSRQIIQRRYQ